MPLFSALLEEGAPDGGEAGRRTCTSRPGKAVVTEGAAGAEFFVILDGQARVERHGRKVAELGPGGFFGDLALLDRAPRNATVIADSEMELAKLGQRAFDDAARRTPASRRSCSPVSRVASARTTPKHLRALADGSDGHHVRQARSR